MLLVCDENEKNLFEHYHFSTELSNKYNVQVIRIYLTTECINDLEVDETNGKLFYREKEISVVYFRTGYQEDKYLNKEANVLKFREKTEMSLAVNIPSLKIHILGMKIVQKFLLMDSFLERIQMKPEQVANIRKHTTEILNIASDFKLNKNDLINAIKDDLNE
jgi:hypothetical protein